MTEIHLLPGL